LEFLKKEWKKGRRNGGRNLLHLALTNFDQNLALFNQGLYPLNFSLPGKGRNPLLIKTN